MRGRHRQHAVTLTKVVLFWAVMFAIAVLSAVNYNLEGRP